MIVSTDFLQQIRHTWDAQLMQSDLGRTLTKWCWEYFEKYGKAPGRDIEGIFYAKVQEGKIPEQKAAEIEEDFLPRLSKEYESEGFNLKYALDEAEKYLKERRVTVYAERVLGLLREGLLEEAELLACNYKPRTSGMQNDLDLRSEVALDRLRMAFELEKNCVIRYPGRFGDFINKQLVRGGLVAFLAPEKRGKTFLLMHMAIRAYEGGKSVAFFQAGDLSEGQFLRRLAVYASGRSDRKRYCAMHYEAVADCIKNQLHDCKKEEREFKEFGVFEGEDEEELKTKITIRKLVAAYKNNPKYLPCKNCEEYNGRSNEWGVPWVREVAETEPLTVDEAQETLERFFKRRKGRFRLSTHANNTLTISHIRSSLEMWEKTDDFVPDVVVIDYADLISSEIKADFRHQQNSIWMGLRRLSQEKGQPLVITATQANADSYDKDSLRLKNFSEDKRKYAHVTAFYGLNQDSDGREKGIGLLRINELMLREDEYNTAEEIKILQNLRRGQPFLDSYY